MAKATTKPGNALQKWDEKWSRLAKVAVAKTGTVSGNFVSTAGGILKIDKVAVPNNTLEAICVDFCFENALYADSFDPDNPQPPICFALGTVEADLVPDPLSEQVQVGKGSPNPDSTCCADCPNNEWASAEKGRGKACKNGRRIGIIASDAIEGDVLAAKVHYLKVPPTSLAAWDGYVNQMEQTIHRPPVALVTSIKPVPSAKGGFTLEFTLKNRIEDEQGVEEQVFSDLEAKQAMVAKEIAFPYQPMAAEDRAAGKSKKAKGPARFTRQGAAAPAKKQATRRFSR